jgi:hypothetical protein
MPLYECPVQTHTHARDTFVSEFYMLFVKLILFKVRYVRYLNRRHVTQTSNPAVKRTITRK